MSRGKSAGTAEMEGFPWVSSHEFWGGLGDPRILIACVRCGHSVGVSSTGETMRKRITRACNIYGKMLAQWE